MRAALAPHEFKRLTFTATFARFGTKRGWKGKEEQTVLLLEVRDGAGAVVADHLWCNLTKQFARLDLQAGDVVRFNARVKTYLKGYLGRREVWDKPPTWDYKLSHPTKVVKLTEDREQLPLPIYATTSQSCDGHWGRASEVAPP